MLKPYICVACEKVIIDQPTEPHPPGTTGPPSLINLFSKMIVEIMPQTDVPANAVGPKEWVIFSMWDVEAGDENKHLFLGTSILYPDGTQFGEARKVPIPIHLGQRSQMAIRINGFPLGQAGFYTVRTWIEEKEVIVTGPIEFKIELQIIMKDNETSQAQIQ